MFYNHHVAHVLFKYSSRVELAFDGEHPTLADISRRGTQDGRLCTAGAVFTVGDLIGKEPLFTSLIAADTLLRFVRTNMIVRWTTSLQSGNKLTR